jgi:hypothetical protein
MSRATTAQATIKQINNLRFPIILENFYDTFADASKQRFLLRIMDRVRNTAGAQ